MPLSREEQRVLDSIEDGLRVDDPVFAAKLTFTAATAALQASDGSRSWLSVGGNVHDAHRFRSCS